MRSGESSCSSNIFETETKDVLRPFLSSDEENAAGTASSSLQHEVPNLGRRPPPLFLLLTTLYSSASSSAWSCGPLGISFRKQV